MLLPWYVNDTLSGKDLESVLRHLSDCRDCQAERDRLYQLQQMVQESDTPVPGHELSYRRVMKRIDAAEQNRDSMQDVAEPRRRSWIPAGLAASVLSLVVAGGAYLGIPGINSSPETGPLSADNAGPVYKENAYGDEYQTLTSDNPGIADNPGEGRARRIELAFANPIPAATLRKALIETNSNIVSGPDAAGHYLVEVVVPAGVTADDYLADIQMIDGVERAQFAP